MEKSRGIPFGNNVFVLIINKVVSAMSYATVSLPQRPRVSFTPRGSCCIPVAFIRSTALVTWNRTTPNERKEETHKIYYLQVYMLMVFANINMFKCWKETIEERAGRIIYLFFGFKLYLFVSTNSSSTKIEIGRNIDVTDNQKPSNPWTRQS